MIHLVKTVGLRPAHCSNVMVQGWIMESLAPQPPCTTYEMLRPRFGQLPLASIVPPRQMLTRSLTANLERLDGLVYSGENCTG
jgi:hypothetical protein